MYEFYVFLIVIDLKYYKYHGEHVGTNTMYKTYVQSFDRMESQDDMDKNNKVEEDYPVGKIRGLKDPNSVSAFEVYSSRHHQYSSNSNIHNAKQKAVTNTIRNPVRLVQEAARKFGLTALSSEIEKIRYSDINLIFITRTEIWSFILHLDYFTLCMTV
jgi:hypothetical protein